MELCIGNGYLLGKTCFQWAHHSICLPQKYAYYYKIPLLYLCVGKRLISYFIGHLVLVKLSKRTNMALLDTYFLTDKAMNNSNYNILCEISER